MRVNVALLKSELRWLRLCILFGPNLLGDAFWSSNSLFLRPYTLSHSFSRLIDQPHFSIYPFKLSFCFPSVISIIMSPPLRTSRRDMGYRKPPPVYIPSPTSSPRHSSLLPPSPPLSSLELRYSSESMNSVSPFTLCCGITTESSDSVGTSWLARVH
jgi:hypothetical protein